MITLYKEKARVFEWSGIRVGLRLPLVEEMKTITAKRDAFFLSITEATPQGDTSIMIDYNFLVGSMLACDPEDATNPWFAKDRDEQLTLRKNGVEKQVAEELPSSFFVAACAFFNEQIAKSDQIDGEKKDDGEDKDDGPLEESGTETIPTAQSSEGSLSVSQSISPLTLGSSTAGDTTVS